MLFQSLFLCRFIHEPSGLIGEESPALWVGSRTASLVCIKAIPKMITMIPKIWTSCSRSSKNKYRTNAVYHVKTTPESKQWTQSKRVRKESGGNNEGKKRRNIPGCSIPCKKIFEFSRYWKYFPPESKSHVPHFFFIIIFKMVHLQTKQGKTHYVTNSISKIWKISISWG